jgi:hypothetical protein
VRKPLNLRYSGFDQKENTRHYIFRRSLRGEMGMRVVVSAEMFLFRKYQIRVQDGPAFCLHTLMLDNEGLEPSLKELPPRVLTDQDAVAYLASLPVPASTKGKREKHVEAS